MVTLFAVAIFRSGSGCFCYPVSWYNRLQNSHVGIEFYYITCPVNFQHNSDSRTQFRQEAEAWYSAQYSVHGDIPWICRNQCYLLDLISGSPDRCLRTKFGEKPVIISRAHADTVAMIIEGCARTNNKINFVRINDSPLLQIRFQNPVWPFLPCIAAAGNHLPVREAKRPGNCFPVFFAGCFQHRELHFTTDKAVKQNCFRSGTFRGTNDTAADLGRF